MIGVEETESSVLTFEQLAGSRIDALETSLNAFDEDDADSDAALREQLRCIRDEAHAVGMPMLTAAADKSHRASPADIRALSTILLALLRSAAHSEQTGHPLSAEERDAVTGTMNHDAFARRFEQLARRRDCPAAMAVVRVDNVESVLHRHGGAAAQKLLLHITEILLRQLRQDDCLAHFGGGEFAILLPGEDEQGLRMALARIELVIMRRPFRLPDGGRESIRITTGGHQFVHRAIEPGANSPLMPLRVGLAMHSANISRVLKKLLAGCGCETVAPNTAGETRYAPFTHHGAQLVILETEASDLPAELARLRTALAHDRTPILVLAANAGAAHWALEHGASEALTMPADLNALTKAACRLVSRGHKKVSTATTTARASQPVLVVSDDLYHLIALGSALQKQGGYEVRLGRGGSDALCQADRHPPCAAIVDLRLRSTDTQELLRHFAEKHPNEPVILVAEPGEEMPAGSAGLPPVAAVFRKPVALLTLAGEFRKATGVEPNGDTSGTACVLQEELLRVLRHKAA